MLNPLRSYKVQRFLKSLIANDQSATMACAAPDIETDSDFQRLYRVASSYTMTSKERMYGLYQAVNYVTARGLHGDFVECGVWRGGSSILAALAFMQLGVRRRFRLFDTFKGMPPPTASDMDINGASAASLLKANIRKEEEEVTYDVRCVASLADVKANIIRSGCNMADFELIQGLVENTVTPEVCDTISILRLDTDWYESTLHELNILYPKLITGGVLIIDDYGHWQGARKAVDDYFSQRPIMLTRLDYTGRIAIKPD